MSNASPDSQVGESKVAAVIRPRVMVVRRADRPCGGDIYEQMIAECLRRDCDVIDYVNWRANTAGRFWNTLRAIWNVRRQVPREDVDVIIMTQDAAIMRPRTRAKRVVMLHHIDYSPTFMGWVYAALRPRLYRVLAEADAVAVPSEFWQDALQKRGLRNVHIVANGYDFEQIDLDEREVEDFRRRYALTGKPVIYLGSTGIEKGGAEAYRELQSLDAHFVVTGAGPAPTPRVRHLRLSYCQYLLLLGASTVAVAMSRFDEGWCRAAHEAMACGTPVVGSGRGGMRELLEGGGQIVCSNLSKLRGVVAQILSDRDLRARLRADGPAYARQFTLDRFTNSWTDLVRLLAN
jgi:glycosyltransferase involved in cell wall biosynthesis